MFQFVLHWNSENSFYSIWNLCHEITKMNNWSEKSRSFLFQSAILKTMRNERKLMVKQFAAEEVIFLCQYLPNNKSITIMIHHCNFFINKYGSCYSCLVKSHTGDFLLLVGSACSDWQRAGDCRQWESVALIRRRSSWRTRWARQLWCGWWCSTRYHWYTSPVLPLSCNSRNDWLQFIFIFNL